MCYIINVPENRQPRKELLMVDIEKVKDLQGLMARLKKSEDTTAYLRKTILKVMSEVNEETFDEMTKITNGGII